jgi:hypothetical protein
MIIVSLVHLIFESEKGGERENKRDREREIERETESCYDRVMAWVINLTVGYEG